MRRANNEQSLIIPLIKCGAINQSLCKLHEISLILINDLKKLGYIIEKDDVIKLTSYGRDFVSNYYKEHKYVYTGYIDKHDLKLMDFYLSLSQSERKTWMTRNEIQTLTSGKAFDGCFVDKNNKKACVSILKKDTQKKIIEELEMTLRELKAEYPFYSFY